MPLDVSDLTVWAVARAEASPAEMTDEEHEAEYLTNQAEYDRLAEETMARGEEWAEEHPAEYETGAQIALARVAELREQRRRAAFRIAINACDEVMAHCAKAMTAQALTVARTGLRAREPGSRRVGQPRGRSPGPLDDEPPDEDLTPLQLAIVDTVARIEAARCELDWRAFHAFLDVIAARVAAEYRRYIEDAA